MQTTILVVEDDAALSEALAETLSLAGYRVHTADNGQAALPILETEAISLIVSDINMPKMDGQALLRQVRKDHPDIPVVLMTAYGSISQAVDAMREGAVDYLVKPFEAEVLVNMVGQYVQNDTDGRDMVAEDPASQELVRLARRVAESDATVLITGESGVGKEVLARFIHGHSPRADGPFVAINCAAIPENMLEATLFGYEKGAYTGAYKASPGKFEQAQGGTLLLDEISEMDLGLQAKLLRVLQEREVERLGGSKTIELDVRVLATSNRDMKQAVAEGRFREDLYYRLNVFPLHIRPLRERPDDIVPIARSLLQKHAARAGRPGLQLTEAACERLRAYPWPGNIRELDNAMQRALILAGGQTVDVGDLHFETDAAPAAPRTAAAPAPAEAPAGGHLNSDLRQREWEVILKTIRDVNGSRKATAERLGISQRTLRYKLARMREAGIRIPDLHGMEPA